MERAIPCELPFFYFRSAQFNSSKNITFVPNLQEIFKVVKRTFLYINLVIALFFVLPVSQAKEKTFTVVIDAGHGGKDPGARGSSINEKAINLAVALRLGSLISEKHDDVKVIYTRKTDVFIELDERANIANRNKADLFISIHTNAVKRGSSVSGTETYTLGLARTDENLEVAMRENSAILLEDNYLQKYEGFDPTSSESYIIFEFMQNKHMEQSISLASEVQKCFASAKRNNRGVRQAGFLVLRKTSMPSILVELGYISNPAEERFMRTKEGQNKLATAIYNAFTKYKWEYDRKRGALAGNASAAPILEVVDNQLRENNPPVTKESYDKLIDAGYSAREAKEKIGAIVIEEIYDVMKENQPYDEKRYTQALRNMVQQCIDYEDTHEILTEWDEWGFSSRL